ncbi:hypothetical protein RBE51_20905 [Pseudomonas taiwanensis]|uniref:hypothetical protein n=1 Tax=Pseudomonas taiwanensis TaxID=470150 RepID=UPI0028DFA428|nr:hypothetical protein [Pseudomonas taiwanensis]MDT8925257.1 hypothetical protein [Pseudomonas taiwanensis]
MKTIVTKCLLVLVCLLMFAAISVCTLNFVNDDQPTRIFLGILGAGWMFVVVQIAIHRLDDPRNPDYCHVKSQENAAWVKWCCRYLPKWLRYCLGFALGIALVVLVAYVAGPIGIFVWIGATLGAGITFERKKKASETPVCED